MPANKYRIRVRMLIHGHFEAAGEVFFTVQTSIVVRENEYLSVLRSILDNRNA